MNGTFSESDLGLGFANNKGHHLVYKYVVAPSVELNLGIWLVERINTEIESYFASSDVRVNGDDNQIIRTQADLVYKF